MKQDNSPELQHQKLGPPMIEADLLAPSIKHSCCMCHQSLVADRVVTRHSYTTSEPYANYCISCFAKISDETKEAYVCKNPRQSIEGEQWKPIELIELMNCVCKYGTSSWPAVQQELNAKTGSARLQGEVADKYWQIYQLKFKGREGLDHRTKFEERDNEIQGDKKSKDDEEDFKLENEFNNILEETSLTSVSGVNKHFVELLLGNKETNAMLNDKVTEEELACLEKWTEEAEWERSALKSSNLHLCRLYIHMSRRASRSTRKRHQDNLVPFDEDHKALSRLYRLPGAQPLFKEMMELREERKGLLERRNKRN